MYLSTSTSTEYFPEMYLSTFQVLYKLYLSTDVLKYKVLLPGSGGLLRYWSVSDRLAVIQLTLGSHSTLAIINAYGPTSQVTLRNQDTQDDFYAALDSITSRYSSSALILIAGDFNSKLGNKLPIALSMGEH